MTKLNVMNRLTTTKRRQRTCLALAAFALFSASYPQIVMAEDAPASKAEAEKPDAEKDANTRQELTKALSRIAELETTLAELKAQRERQTGVRQEMLNARVTRTLDDLISLSQSTAKTYIDKAMGNPDFADQRTKLVKVIESIPVVVGEEIDRIRRTINLPRPQQTPLEQAALGADLATSADRDYQLIQALVANNAIAEQIGLDVTAAETRVKQHLSRSAANASAYLDVTMNDLHKLRLQLKTLPKNEELTAKIAVTEQRMQLAADILRRRAERMREMEMNVSDYDTQLIAATGALSTQVFDLGVMQGLATDFVDKMVNWLEDNGARMLFQALVFVVILVIAWKLAHLGEVILKRALNSERVHFSQLLQRMIVSTTRSVILILGILIGLSQLGISIGPLLAGLGIAGFIVGFALQDSLSNFASGLMILIYRPFDVGDIVDVNGAFGRVRHMSLVNTTIHTFDNQSVIVPNNQIWQNAIKNLTGQDTRRVDMTFGISYGDDIEKAERVLRQIVASNENVLAEPEPLIHLHELGDSSVNFIVRPWVKTDDYWETYWAITRAVKMRFDAEGISIPFPQRDVHLYTHSAPKAP